MMILIEVLLACRGPDVVCAIIADLVGSAWAYVQLVICILVCMSQLLRKHVAGSALKLCTSAAVI